MIDCMVKYIFDTSLLTNINNLETTHLTFNFTIHYYSQIYL